MTVLLSQYVQPQDQGDVSLAWDRCIASIATPPPGDYETIVIPPGEYETSKSLDVNKRVLVLAWGVRLKARQSSGVRIASKGSVIVGLEVLGGGTASAPTSHGFDISAKARLVWCTARNFGGDGFRIVADVNAQPPTSASTSQLYGCESTGHAGRGFSAQGGDANAILFVACSTSACGGEYAGRPSTAPKVGGFHDASFLGCYFIACHSGVHASGVVSYCAVGDSSRSVVAACYSEMGHAIRVDAQNVAAWNVGSIDPASTGTAYRGNTITGKFVFPGIGAQTKPALTFSPNQLDGMLAAVTSALDTHGYAVQRVTSGARDGWWTLRRANTATQDVLAVQCDVKTNQPPALWAPLGMLVGASKKALSDQWMASIETRLAALENKP